MEEVDGIETSVLDLNIEVDGYIDIGMANIIVGSLVNGSAGLGLQNREARSSLESLEQRIYADTYTHAGMQVCKCKCFHSRFKSSAQLR